MSKLHIHEKFTTTGIEGYKGVIAEYELDNDNTLESCVDKQVGVFWLNEFRPDGVMTTARFDPTYTYDDAIKMLIEWGKKINKQLIIPKPNRV
jgi:hypothetical protein